MSAQRLGRTAGTLGLAGLFVSLLIAALSENGFAELQRRYLVAFSFVLSLGLGALFFVILQHLTNASWSVVVRRVAELVAATLPGLFVLSLPLLLPALLGDASVWAWLDGARVASSELLQKKTAYLNAPFFAARWLVYFAIWSWLSRSFLRRSLKQDETGDAELSAKMRRLSGPAIVLFALTTTFAAFDLLMSIDPEWFSTIFGVHFFAGSVVGFLATHVLALVGLQRAGHLRDQVNREHYHDLGKLLFAFVFFWGYIAFSQYMLIWYANIPEETVWFAHRSHGFWGALGIVLVFGHLILPFAGLLSRHVKRNPRALAFWAGWLLVMHWLDTYWLVMPTFISHGSPFHALDLTALVGVTGVAAALVARHAGGVSLVPARDPRLQVSLEFHNH